MAIVIGGLAVIAGAVLVAVLLGQYSGSRAPVGIPISTETQTDEGAPGPVGISGRTPGTQRDVDRALIEKVAPTPAGVCGNRICDAGESITTCLVDCIDRDIFDRVSFLKRGDRYLVTWTTAEPMTTKAELGSAEGSYVVAVYEDGTPKTEHVAEFIGLEDNVVYFVKLSGQNAAGRISFIEGYSGGFE